MMPICSILTFSLRRSGGNFSLAQGQKGLKPDLQDEFANVNSHIFGHWPWKAVGGSHSLPQSTCFSQSLCFQDIYNAGGKQKCYHDQ